MQSQKISNFFSLQNPLVKKKKQNTTQQQRETQVQKMKTANKVQKAKQTSRVVVWGVGGGGDHFARKKIPIVLGCFNLTLSLTKHRTNLSSYYWNGVLVYNLWLIFYSDILDLNSFLVFKYLFTTIYSHHNISKTKQWTLPFHLRFWNKTFL